MQANVLADVVHNVSHDFAIVQLEATELAFRIVWDMLEPFVREGAVVGKAALEPPKNLYLGLAADDSKLLIAIATSTFASALWEISRMSQRPTITEMGKVIDRCAASFQAPRSLRSKLRMHLAEFVDQVNFYERANVTFEEKRDVWFAGAKPSPLTESQIESLLERNNPDLVVDEDDRTVRTMSGQVQGLTRSQFDVLTFVLKSSPGTCPYERLLQHFWLDEFQDLTKKKTPGERQYKEEELKGRLRQYVKAINVALKGTGLSTPAIVADPGEGLCLNHEIHKPCLLGVSRFATARGGQS